MTLRAKNARKLLFTRSRIAGSSICRSKKETGLPKTIRERPFINLFHNDGRCQTGLRPKSLLQSCRQLVLQHIPNQQFSKYGATPLISQDKAQRRYALDNTLSVIQTGVGTGPQNTSNAGAVSTKGTGGCQQIAADLHRDRQIARDRTAYNLVLFRECTSGTIKVNGPDRIGLPYPGNQIVPYLSRDLLFRLEKGLIPPVLIRSISRLPDTILQSVFVEPPSAINIVFATIQSKYI